jgi:hypothetical protein
MTEPPSTRPEGLEPHMPYVCSQTGVVRIDVLPANPEQIRQTGDRLRELYKQNDP